MKTNKILLLGTYIEGHYIEALNIFINAMVANGAVFLSYFDLYLEHGHSGTERFIEEYIDKNSIDTVLYDSAPTEFTLSPLFWERLRKKCFMILWTGDTEHYLDIRDRYYAQAMDYVVSSDFSVPAKLGQLGIKSDTYFGYTDAKRLDKKNGLKKDIDVSFVGTITGKVNRPFYINHLIKNGLDVKTYGTGSNQGFITFDGKVDLYNRTKINLNLSGVAETTRLTKHYTIQKRMKAIKGNLFEAALCGGFVLSEYSYQLEKLFIPGKEIVIFHNEDDLLEKTRYYLTHDREREEIAEKGYQRAHSERGYDVKPAVEDLLVRIETLRSEKTYRPSPIYLDTEFMRNFSTYRVFLGIRLLKQGKFRFAFEELLLLLKFRKLDLYQVKIFLIEEVLDKFPKTKRLLKSIFERAK